MHSKRAQSSRAWRKTRRSRIDLVVKGEFRFFGKPLKSESMNTTIKQKITGGLSSLVDDSAIAEDAVRGAERAARAKPTTTKRGKNLRISARLREAIRLLVTTGCNVSQSAEQAGLKPQSLYKALKRPHVQAFKKGILQAHANEWGALSVALTAKLMDDPEVSPAIRLQAQQEMRRIAGLQCGAGDARTAPTTRLVIDLRANGSEAEIEERGNVVAVKNAGPIKLH